MAEHHALGVTCCAACVDYAAAHPWLLLLDPREDCTVLNLSSKLHYLAPVEDLDFLPAIGPERDPASLFSSALCEEEAGDHSTVGKLVFIAVQEGSLQALVGVADDNLCACLFDLLEADLRAVRQVRVRVDAVGEDTSHDTGNVLRRVDTLQSHA